MGNWYKGQVFFDGIEGILFMKLIKITKIFVLTYKTCRYKALCHKILMNFDRFFAGTNLERAGTEGVFAGTERKQAGFLRKYLEQKGYIWNKRSRFGYGYNNYMPG